MRINSALINQSISTLQTRPLNPKPRPPPSTSSEPDKVPVKTTDWVGQAGTQTVSLSKRVATDTSSLANSLWSTINQFRLQLGWAGLSKEAAEEAKRLVYIGRQQQEARSWIAAWRSRTVGSSKSDNEARLGTKNTRVIAAQQRQQDEADLATMQEMGKLLHDKVIVQGEDHPEEQREAVEAVLAALERAQRAAEEAAASSSALERAIEQAESAGAISSSDEEDDFHPLMDYGDDFVVKERKEQR